MAVTCYGQSAGVFHISPGGGFFADDGMCLNSPIDASEYPSEDTLYVYANINYSSPNIRTVFPDGSEDVYYASSSQDYMWIYWNWNGWGGDVMFELRDGTSVKATLTTTIDNGVEPDNSCEIIEIDKLYKRVMSPPDYGITATIKNASSKVAEFAIILAGTTKNTGCTVLQPGQQQSIECHFDDPGYNECLNFEVIVNRSIVCNEFSACWDVPPSPCDGVVCDDICIVGGDLYSQKCVTDGVNFGCDYDYLLETNSPTCPGYVPPDPCEGVVCEPECVGNDMYITVCDNGICIRSGIIEENSTDCGYIPPEPDPDEDITDILIDNKEIVLGGTIAGIVIVKYMYDKLHNK